MRDFWIASGFHLLDRNTSGGLVVTDDFLKAYFARPELIPPEDACKTERKLHRELLSNPRLTVGSGEVAAIADADARENWQFILALRDLLLRHPTLESVYLALVRSASISLPPLFVNQLVQVILRNALEGCEDPFVIRAGELFFRPQRIMTHGQALLLGDEELVGAGNGAPVLPLNSMLGTTADAQVEIISEANAESYWRRSDRFDMGFDLSGGCRARSALAQVMVRWVSHLLGIDVTIEPIAELCDARFTWYVGLDTEATRIGDQLWRGEAIDGRTADRVLALFRLTFADPRSAADPIVREPVYLILAMASDRIVRMKPQNLLTGLPIKQLEAVS